MGVHVGPEYASNNSMGTVGMYGHLFDKNIGETELEFDKLVIDLTEENKHLVIPMLFKLIQEEEQKNKLQDICDRMNFDFTSLELGVNPEPDNNSIY